MNYFACKKIEYLFFENAQMFGTNIVPKTGFAFLPLLLMDKPEFSESGKTEDTDIYYEQKLDVITKYSSVGEIQILHNKHFILRLTKVDGSTFIWGSLSPENPVQLEIDSQRGLASLDFFRYSSLPEA